MVGLRVGCGLINEEVLSVLLALRTSLSVPRRLFKKYFRQRGCLSLFFFNANQFSGVCQVSLLQLGQYLPGLLPVTSPSPPPFLANSAVKRFHFLQKAGVGVSEGVNSVSEGGILIYHFLQHSLTCHRNPSQAVETTFQIFHDGRGGASRGRFLPPSGTAKCSTAEFFCLLSPRLDPDGLLNVGFGV